MTQVLWVQHQIGSLLAEAATYFKGDPKITIIVRPDVAPGKDGDFIMTNDALPDAIAAIERRMRAEKGGEADGRS